MRKPRWRPPDAKSCIQLFCQFLSSIKHRDWKLQGDDAHLAKAVQHMYELRIDQPRRIKRQDGGKRNRIRISRVENAETIHLVTYVMELVPLAEFEELFQRLW